MSQGARVSVVMPAYNAAETIEAAMRSVLDQHHADVELIVVDDCSRDDTWWRVQEIAATDPRVRALRQDRNFGVAAARNAGIDAATGRYIAFLDSDDRWHPAKLGLQLAHMQATGTRVSYTAYQRVAPDGRPLSTVRPPPVVRYRDMLRSNCIGNLTGLYDRSLGEVRFRRIGHEDYAFWLQVVRLAGEAACAGLPEPLAYYLVRPGSLSANKLRAARWQWRILRDVERIGRVRAAAYLVEYAARAVAKRI